MPSYKTLCPVHRYYYTGNSCPICQQEKYEMYSRRFVTPEIQQVKVEKEVTDEDLMKLKAKFMSI